MSLVKVARRVCRSEALMRLFLAREPHTEGVDRGILYPDDHAAFFGGDDKTGGHMGSTSGVVDPWQYGDGERKPGRLIEDRTWILVVLSPSDQQVLLSLWLEPSCAAVKPDMPHAPELQAQM